MESKYIVFNNNNSITPVIFPAWVKHEAMANCLSDIGWKPTSAGFITIEGYSKPYIYAHGESISLNLSSKAEDSRLLTKILFPET